MSLSIQHLVNTLTLLSAWTGFKEKEINCLGVLPGDIGSALFTMARLRCEGGEQPVNMYVMESHPETLARHVLLMSIVFDEDLGPRECTELFLEIYGNAMLRKQTSAYLMGKIEALVRWLTNGETELAPIIDVSLLKSKQRDALESVFKSWHEEVLCDMLEWREVRIRTLYGERFDYRKNLIDWDWSMSINEWAGVIHTRLFQQWRHTGCAFEIRDSKYPQPNRTLASYAEGREKGYAKLKRGYWGDIQQSPYWSFGVYADEPKLFKKRSHQFVKTCQHIAEYNIYSILHALRTGERYKMPPEDDEITGRSFWSGLSERATAKLDEIPEEEATAADRLDTLGGGAATTGSKVARKKFKIFLLQGNNIVGLEGKKRFAGLFNMVWLSSFAATDLRPSLASLLQEQAHVVAERGDFLLGLDRNDRKAFNKRQLQLAAAIGLQHRPGLSDRHLLNPSNVQVPFNHFTFERETAAQAAAIFAAEAAAKGGNGSDGSLQGLLEASNTDERPTEEQLQQHALQKDASPEAEPSTESALACGTSSIVVISGGAAELDTRPAKEEQKPKAGPCGICAITGLPAKYKDPKTGLPYANIEAFKQLRLREAGSEVQAQAEEIPAAPLDAQVEKPHETVHEDRGKDGEEEDELPLFMRKKKGWGLGGAALY